MVASGPPPEADRLRGITTPIDARLDGLVRFPRLVATHVTAPIVPAIRMALRNTLSHAAVDLGLAVVDLDRWPGHYRLRSGLPGRLPGDGEECGAEHRRDEDHARHDGARDRPPRSFRCGRGISRCAAPGTTAIGSGAML
jgi:hypothetical protein